MNKQEKTISITLPDGSNKTFPKGTQPMAIAKSIGPGLAKSTIAARVNGELILKTAVNPA